MEKQTIIEKGTNVGLRLDKWIAKQCDLSRARVKDLLDNGHILVNGEKVKASTSIQQGDVVDIEIPEIESTGIEPENIPLDIIYEDDQVLVVNKPTGMVVHPSAGHHSGTLVHALLYHCTDLPGINGEDRPGIVHRIDKDTSGLLVVAKTEQAMRSLQEQLADKTCKREYLAIVQHPFNHEHGTIDAPIGRDPKNRKKMAVTENNSKEAITHFQVLENFADYSYIRCQLETGRTHQIRAHMAYIGHPVAADPLYGYKKSLPGHGQYLHACQLEFVHPTTKETMCFKAPCEKEFEDQLEQLRKD